MSLIRETAFYNDSNITGSAYNVSNKKLSVIFKDGHIDEVQLSDKSLCGRDFGRLIPERQIPLQAERAH